VIAYRKFSDTLQNEPREPIPPKPPKIPKVALIEQTFTETLGALDALGARAAGSRKSEPPAAPTEPTGLMTEDNADREYNASVLRGDAARRSWADGLAQLDPFDPPGDVPAVRWRRFVDDARRFLDSPFCAVAAGLGWGPHDLFGCDRDRPFARIDRNGLLWLVNGNKIVALSDGAAVLEGRAGARQTFRRPAERGCVLAWELSRKPIANCEEV
jgi:hypothetical protein